MRYKDKGKGTWENKIALHKLNKDEALAMTTLTLILVLFHRGRGKII